MIFQNYNETCWNTLNSKMEKEAEDWLFHILFKTHHLQRTYQKKGVYSLKEDIK